MPITLYTLLTLIRLLPDARRRPLEKLVRTRKFTQDELDNLAAQVRKITQPTKKVTR